MGTPHFQNMHVYTDMHVYELNLAPVESKSDSTGAKFSLLACMLVPLVMVVSVDTD